MLPEGLEPWSGLREYVNPAFAAGFGLWFQANAKGKPEVSPRASAAGTTPQQHEKRSEWSLRQVS